MNINVTRETTINCSDALTERSNDLLSTVGDGQVIRNLILTNDSQRALFEFRQGMGMQLMQARGECGYKGPISLLRVQLEPWLDLKVQLYAEMVEHDALRGRWRHLSGVLSPQCVIMKVDSPTPSLFLRGVTLEELDFNNGLSTAFHNDWMYGVGSGMASLMIDASSESLVMMFAELSCPDKEAFTRYVIPIGMASVGDIRHALSEERENGGVGAIHGRRFMTASLEADSIQTSSGIDR